MTGLPLPVLRRSVYVSACGLALSVAVRERGGVACGDEAGQGPRSCSQGPEVSVGLVDSRRAPHWVDMELGERPRASNRVLGC